MAGAFEKNTDPAEFAGAFLDPEYELMRKRMADMPGADPMGEYMGRMQGHKVMDALGHGVGALGHGALAGISAFPGPGGPVMRSLFRYLGAPTMGAGAVAQGTLGLTDIGDAARYGQGYGMWGNSGLPPRPQE